MFNTKKRKTKKGFTLVEMMVSVAIFTIVITVGIGALVNMVQKYKVSQQEKQAADSLGFVLETLTREIRLGSNYLSGEGTAINPSDTVFVSVKSDTKVNLISFDAADGRGYILYYLQNGILYKTTTQSGASIDEKLTDPTQVIITKARVVIKNAEKEDEKQPLVWFQFGAQHPSRFGPDMPLKIIQTLVSQRLLDI